MAELVTIGWNEDIDLNAGAAAIAALKGQDHLRKLVGTDAIKINNPGGVHLHRISWADEEATVILGGGTLSRDDKTHVYRFGLKVVTPGTIKIASNGGLGDHIPKGTQLDCLGNGSGSTAEEHTVLMDLIRPDLQEVEKAPWGSWTRELIQDVDSGTLVAHTVSGLVDIVNNFVTDQALGTDPKKKACLISIFGTPNAAGYGVVGVVHPNGIIHRLWPNAKLPLVAMGHQPEVEHFLTDINGNPAPWLFTVDSPPLLVAAGVGTAGPVFGMRIGLFE